MEYTVLDVGCSKLVISGRVKVKHGVEVAEFKEESVVFSDGSEIPADVIIFAYVFSFVTEVVPEPHLLAELATI